MVELKNCPFLIQGNWCNDIYGPCAAAKGNRCEVHQQLAKRDARIAELEAERDRLRETICRIERKINSAKTACPPFVQREFEEAQKWAYEALKGAGDE